MNGEIRSLLYKWHVLGLVLLSLYLPELATSQSIKNIRTSVEDGRVEVLYDLVTKDSNQVNIAFKVRLDSTELKNLLLVNGDIFGVKAGLNKRIVWSALAELGELKGELQVLLTILPRTVKIGNQIWMTENLNVDTFRNGDKIPQAKTKEEWVRASKSGKPVWCYNQNLSSNGLKYGKLYNGYAVTDPRGLAPEGFHIPTEQEWNVLMEHVKTPEILQSTLYWTPIPNENASKNGTRFAALPGGLRRWDGSFIDVGYDADWWSSTESANPFIEVMPDDKYALSTFRIISSGGNTNMSVSQPMTTKGFGLSVRCLKD